ncbi:MAG: glycosyltransferase [Gammaproteobacteria bacterium]|nr:glycosyltransferase [Gammaproteobacteria bacterium]
MPTYNRSQMVQRAIASVLAQDYPHFELLIVDDCSKDDTWMY